MFRRLFTISLIFVLTFSFVQAQNKAVLKSDGSVIKLENAKDMHEALQISKIKNAQGINAVNKFPGKSFTAAGKLDTLTMRKLGGTWNTNFGFNGGDVFLNFFEAPADLTIKAAGFGVTDATGSANTNVSVRLMKFNWTMEDFKQFGGQAYRLGYYPEDNDGHKNSMPFPEGNAGPWVSYNPTTPSTMPWEHADYDLWSDEGLGWPVDVPATTAAGEYYWVDMINLGFEPTVAKGEVFGVVLIHNGADPLGDRFGVYADNSLGFGNWKYYEGGRSASSTSGDWWVREYLWDLVVAVDITGDTPPTFVDFDILGTTLSTQPRPVSATITDENPGGGAAGVANAYVVYSIDNGNPVEAPMQSAGNDLFNGELPGANPGQVVSYYYKAVDVNSNESTTLTYSYSIYKPTDGVKSLVVFNGGTGKGYPGAYYFRQDTNFIFDKWAFGALTEELVNNYQHIFEICTGGPNDYNREVIGAWLAADNARNYFLAGEEWLGADNGYTDQDYAAGTFEHDILGLAHSYNDITYDGSGQGLASKLIPMPGSLLGNELANAFAATGADSLLYDPIFELGAATNWMDAFDAVDPSNVDLKVETRGIGGATDVQELPAAVHNVTANGNKTVFMTMDPLSIDTQSPAYFWLSDTTAAIHYQAVTWFGANVVGVEEETVPSRFDLAQNYPNPFNPSTKIVYAVPSKSNVTLKVYNLLGQEIATLVNAVKNVGRYELTFNASNMPSGVYFYTLTAGNFTITKKMMLIK